jgi:hypothetical protein
VVSIPIPNTVVVVGVVVVVVVVAVFGVFVGIYVMVGVTVGISILLPMVPVVEGKLRMYSSMIDYDISYSTMIE